MSGNQWPTASLGELVSYEKLPIHPSDLGDTAVDHYSLPAFDRARSPERVTAGEIKSTKLTVSQPMVLVSRLNPHIPRVWSVSPGERPALASTEFAPLVPKSVPLEYLYAVCLSSDFQGALAARVTGTSTSHQRVKPQDLLSLPVPLPPRPEQERIGTLVTTIERRRLLAQRLAATGDQIVQRLFRRIFPDAFDGETPLAELSTTTTGVSYRSAELGGTEQALVTLKCFARDGSYRDSGLKPWTGDAKVEQVLEEGDVVVAHTDLTQAADVLGRAVVVRRSSTFKRLVASLDVAVVRPRAPLTREYLMGLTRQPEFRRYCQARANGTTVLHLGRRVVPTLPITVPSRARIESYRTAAGPLLSRQLLADEETCTLTRLQKSVLTHFFSRPRG